jgi:hypothetical protein
MEGVESSQRRGFSAQPHKGTQAASAAMDRRICFLTGLSP